MKKRKMLMIITTILFMITNVAAQDLKVKTLNNGMQVAVKENRSNTSVGFYCFVKTGSRNEGIYLGAGISHYLEHVVSGGTTDFRTEDEYEALGKEIGSIVNAYTTDEVTAFHIIVDKEYGNEALQILSEQVTSCAFSLKEINREKEVILKEIVMRSTPPSSKIRQRFNELCFPTSNSRYPVIGYTELYKTITPEELEDYYNQRYCPNNMIFVAVGDFEAEEMLSEIEETFNQYPRQQIQPVYLPPQNIRTGTLKYIEEFNIQQPSIIIGSIISPSDFEDDVALNAALEILFAKRRSPIRYKLVEEMKLVNYIYAYSTSSMTDTEGVIYIGFEAKDPKDIENIISIVDEDLKKYSEIGFTEEQILNIITREKASRLLSTPSVESECNRIGWNLIKTGVADNFENRISQLERLTSVDLQAALEKHIIPQNRIILYAMPEGTSDVLDQSEDIVVEKGDIEKYEINNKITLLHKFNNEKPLIRGVIQLPIDTNYEDINSAGTLNFLTEIMFSGSKHYNPLDLSEWCEDHSVILRSSTNLNGTTINFKCLKDDYPELEKIIIDAFSNPIFPEDEINLAKEYTMANFQRSRSDALSLHDDYRNSLLYGETRGGISEEIRTNNIMGLKKTKLKKLYNDYFKVESAIFTLFGDIDEKTAEASAKKIYKSLPSGSIDFPKNYTLTPDLGGEHINQYSFEQVNIDINYPAPDINDDDFYGMKVLELLLSGSRGKIHKAVRGDKNNLAYFAYPNYGYSEENGFLRLTSQTSINKKDELRDVLTNEIEKLLNEPVTQEEINETIRENVMMMQSILTDNYLPGYVTMHESVGLGFDFMNQREAIYMSITPEDIQRIARKYLSNPTVIVSIPNEEMELMVK